jgi:hypothetical protein
LRGAAHNFFVCKIVTADELLFEKTKMLLIFSKKPDFFLTNLTNFIETGVASDHAASRAARAP